MILHIIVYINKNHVSYNYIYTYYVGFISICNGIIGADAVGLPVLFTDCESHRVQWSIIIPWR